jgi:hypothetical protein
LCQGKSTSKGGFAICYDILIDIDNDLIEFKEKLKFVEYSKLPTIIVITKLFSGDHLVIENSGDVGCYCVNTLLIITLCR